MSFHPCALSSTPFLCNSLFHYRDFLSKSPQELYLTSSPVIPNCWRKGNIVHFLGEKQEKELRKVSIQDIESEELVSCSITGQVKRNPG